MVLLLFSSIFRLITHHCSNFFYHPFHYLANHCCDFLYYQFYSRNLWLFTGEYADSWVTRSERFLDRQDAQAHILSLGPFLLGLNNFVSQPWIQALKEVKLLEGNRSVYRNKSVGGTQFYVNILCRVSSRSQSTKRKFSVAED